MPRKRNWSEAELALIERFRRVFDSPDGRIVLAHLFEVFHGAKSTYTPGRTEETFIKIGQRDVVLYIDLMRGHPLNLEVAQTHKSIVEQTFPEPE